MTGKTMTTEELAALSAADALEQLARDLRVGRVRLEKWEEDRPFDGAVPTGIYGIAIQTRAEPVERREPITARVDGITIGPVIGFGVEPRAGSNVELTIRCHATYDEVETFARLANERVRLRGRASRIPGGDVGSGG
jgi:hypothetical protein